MDGDLHQSDCCESSEKWLDIFQSFCVCQSGLDTTSCQQIIK